MSVTSIFKSFPVSRQTHAELKREIRRSDADAFRDVWVKLLGKPRRRFLKRMASEPLLDEHECMTHELWTSLSGKIHDYLASVTLAHLVAQQRGVGVAEIQDNTQSGSRRRTGTKTDVASVL